MLDLGPQGRKKCYYASSPPFAVSERTAAGRAGLWPIKPGGRAECAAAAPGRTRRACACRAATARTAPAGGQSAAETPGDATQCGGAAASAGCATTAAPAWATAASGRAATTPRRSATSGPGQSRRRRRCRGCCGRRRCGRRRHRRHRQTSRAHARAPPASGTRPYHRVHLGSAAAAFCCAAFG